MRGDRFEWDDEKARRNLVKHGVSFEEAAQVFDGLYTLDEPDETDLYEERWRSLGVGKERVVFVVWTERYENIIRIISARPANRHEEDRYYRQAFPQK